MKKIRMQGRWSLLLSSFCLFGCATPPSVAPAQASARHEVARVDVPSDTLGASDIFEVSVYDERELSGSYRVATDGSIDFPLVGRVAVAGLTSTALAGVLRNKLLRYMTNPQVSVFVKEYHSKKIYVFGEVRKPGTFVFEDGMTIIQAITLAGGFDKLADQNGAFINRVVNGTETRIEVSVKDIGKAQAPNVELRPGDIVYIPESMF